MEAEKLEKRIRDWATALGYTLPDGSAIPPNSFASLSMTPHRRELWEQIIEAVQPRKKVEFMRKQLLILSLKESKESSKHFDNKKLMSRVQLLRKQSLLEKEIKEKKNFIWETEKNFICEAGALIFEICKIAELEKQCREYKEKTLLLYLLTRKEKKLMEKLEQMMLKLAKASDLETFNGKLRDKLKGMDCKSLGHCHIFDLINKMKDLYKSGASEESLWEEIMMCKQSLLDKFLELLKELKTREEIKLRENESGAAETLRSLLIQLKQKITEKSLQVLVNKIEGQVLKAEIDHLEEKMEGLLEGGEDGSLKDSISFGMSDSGRKDSLVKVKNLVRSVGMSCYEEFLRSEVARAEDEVRKKQLETKAEGEREYQRSLDSIDSVANEIHLLIKESEEKEREILELRERLRTLGRNPKDHDVNDRMANMEETVAGLKAAADKQIELLMETPTDAFRETAPSPSGESLEWESLDRNSGAQIKRFFSATLLSPFQDTCSILEEVGRRKKMVEDSKKFISERTRLSGTQALLLSQATSASQFDSQLCEKNFKESETVLGKTLLRADELRFRIEFAEKILKNWLEQPYRLMINETKTVDGKTLKECEEKAARNK